MEIKQVKISDLKMADWNPRIMPDHEMSALINSIREFGIVEPIVVNQDNTIVGGHQRFLAYLQLGKKEIPCFYVDLSKQKEKVLNIALNRIHGIWNEQKLLGILKEIELSGDGDFDLTGFEKLELHNLEDKFLEERADADDIPETPKVAKSKLGEIYQLGNHRLMCGDATKREDVEKLMDGKKADMVFTDPPYGMDKGFANDEKKDFELQDWNNEWMKVLNEVSKENCNILICHSPRLFWTLINPALSLKWEIGRYFTLYKPNDMTFPWHCWLGVSETMLLFMKGKPEFNNDKPVDTSFWHDTYNWSHKNLVSGEDKADGQLYHPTVKPLPVCQDLIWKCSFKNNIVLDTFGGSGTTLIACEQTNRVCFIMEIEPIYVDVIIQRWENFTSKQAVLIDKSGDYGNN